jgi:tetratricopeptide (TPR) repeat protein
VRARLTRPTIRAVRRRVGWPIGELYLSLGVALAREKRFGEAAEAFELARREDRTLELDVLAELASCATRAGDAERAVRANLELALGDPRQASRLAARSIGSIDPEVARAQSVWITDDWLPAIRARVRGRAAMWPSLLAARAALHRGADDLCLELLSDARAADPARAPQAAEQVLGRDAIPSRLRDPDAAGRWLLARAFAAAGRSADAVNAVDAALGAGFPDEKSALTLKARLLEEAGRDTDAAQALLLLGRAFDLEVRHEEAVAVFERANARDPSDPLILWYLADSRRLAAERPNWPYADVGALEVARGEWARGLALRAPGPPEGWAHQTGALLAEFLALAQDETGEDLWLAALQAEQSVALDPGSADAWAFVSRYHRLLAHPATAVCAAERAVAADAWNFRAIVEHVETHVLRCAPELEQVLDGAAKRMPGHLAWLHGVGAWARLLAGDPESARVGFGEALVHEPARTRALARRALAAALAEDSSAATTDALEVLRLTEPTGGAPGIDRRDHRALAALVLERYALAEELFERLTGTRWVDSTEARAGAACARLLAGDREGALRWMGEFAQQARHPAQPAFAAVLLELAAARTRGPELDEMRRLLADAAERVGAQRYDGEAARAELAAERAGAPAGSVRWLVATAVIARTLVEEERLPDAAAFLVELLDHPDPRTGFAPAGRMLADVLRRAGERGDAETVAAGHRRLVELDACSPAAAALAVAAAHLAGGRPHAALAELERAANDPMGELATEEGRALHVRAGDLLLADGRLAEAGAAYGVAGGALATASSVTVEEGATLEMRLGLLAAAERRLGDASGHFRCALGTLDREGAAASDLRSAVGTHERRDASAAQAGTAVGAPERRIATLTAANVVIGSVADVLALADSRWLDGALRGLTEDPVLSPIDRRRLTAARFEMLRRGPRMRGGQDVRPLLIETARDLLPDGERSDGARVLFKQALPRLRHEILRATGVRVGGVRVRVSNLLPPGDYRLLLNEVPYGGGSVDGATGLCLAVARCRELGATGTPWSHPFSGLDGLWLDDASAIVALESGLELLAPFEAIAWHLGGLVRVYLAQTLGLSEVEHMLDEWTVEGGAEAEALVSRAMPDKSARARLLLVLRALVRGQVPVDDLGRILTVMARIDARTPLGDVTEAVRAQLRRSLSGVVRGRRVIEVPGALERAIGDQLDASRYPASGELRERLREHIGPLAPGEFVLRVARGDLRPAVQRLMETILATAAVLSPVEFAPERTAPPRQPVSAGRAA